MVGKALQLLKDAVPGVRHVAILSTPANPSQPRAVSTVKAAAQSLGLTLLLLETREAAQFERAFAV